MNLNQFFSTGKLQGDWLCQMGKGNFRPPTESTPLNRWPKNLLQVITSRPLRLCQIRCTYVHGGFWAHGWNITKLIFIYAPFWGTYLQVRHVDGFSRIMAQTTRTRARMCLFKDFSHGSPLRGSPKKQFLDMNRRFQAKLAKSKNVHIIKTTASIPTKLCTVIKTTKCPSRMVPTHASQIQDSGRPLSWKNRKITIPRPRNERFPQNMAQWQTDGETDGRADTRRQHRPTALA